MLRTGEDWDSQQHGDARSVIEINNYKIFRSSAESIRTTKELEAHLFVGHCVKLGKLSEWNVEAGPHICFIRFVLWLFVLFFMII